MGYKWGTFWIWTFSCGLHTRCIYGVGISLGISSDINCKMVMFLKIMRNICFMDDSIVESLRRMAPFSMIVLSMGLTIMERFAKWVASSIKSINFAE